MIIKVLFYNYMISFGYHTKICTVYSLNFIVDNLFSLKIKNFQKVIFITLFLQIYNYIFFFFFEMIHILQTIVIMYYIFLVSFGTIKIFKFQNYYSNSHSLKKIIMITKTYHIITIYITQIIYSILNPKLYFPILK